MKKYTKKTGFILLLATTLTTFFILSSCKDDVDYYEKPNVTISPDAENGMFIFEQVAGTKKLTLNTNRKWKITTSPGSDWLAVTPTSGEEGQYTIELSVLSNEGDAREATITITASSKKFVYTIMQKSKDGKTIEYTPLEKIIEMGENTDRTGFTIEDDIRIRAIVTTDYHGKQFPFAGYHHIQDNSGAIVLTVPKGDSPIEFGTEVTAKIKGCKLSNYNGTVQIEIPVSNMILVENKAIEPKVVTISEINEGKYPNQYVRINEVQFSAYKDVKFFNSNYSTTRHEITDKQGNTATLDVWKTAVFKDETVPEGSGTLTCVVTMNKSKSGKIFYNLRPSNRSDIQFDQPRFTVEGGGDSGGNDDENLPYEWDGQIKNLKNKYTGNPTALSESFTIKGVVISSLNNSNSNKNIFIADGYAGIQVRFTIGLKPSEIQIGDEIEIETKGGSLSRYQGGGMQLEISNTGMKKVKKEHRVKPIEVTFDDLMSNRLTNELESRLVTLKEAQFTTAGIAWKGAKTTYHQLEPHSSAVPPTGFSLPTAMASKYSSFDFTLMENNGTITGALSVGKYNENFAPSIWISKESDIKFDQPRK